MDRREKEITKGVISILKKQLNPSKIIIFGSRAKGKNSRHADFDFALDCPKPSISTERKINQDLEKVAGLYRIDIAYLDSIDKEFKEVILKAGKVIYERRK